MKSNLPTRRSATADSLRTFRNTFFHHKSAPRGGSQPSCHGEYLDETREAREVLAEIESISVEARCPKRNNP